MWMDKWKIPCFKMMGHQLGSLYTEFCPEELPEYEENISLEVPEGPLRGMFSMNE